MPEPHASVTTAENLEQKFDSGGEVLDYFDLSSAKVIETHGPRSSPAVSVDALGEAIEIAEEIERLQGRLMALLHQGKSAAAGAR